MMKRRWQLTAAEIPALYATLDRHLDRVGLVTQPEVAVRVLELASDPDAQISEYVKVIKTDAGMVGRLLKLANSAYFAQRKAVTGLDRACVLLGIERLRAFSLGFYLAKSASTDADKAFARRCWSQAVYRACLAAELARTLCREHVSEAFVIGLLMDAGQPIMMQLQGQPYAPIAGADGSPAVTPPNIFKGEFQNLPYTHVDVMAALMKRWKLPDILCKPIEWHHAEPSDATRSEAVHRLHRLAYYVGAVSLDGKTGLPVQPLPLSGVAERVLGMPGEQLSPVVQRACDEYKASVGVFSSIADRMADLESLSLRVQAQLVAVIDESLVSSLNQHAAVMPRKFTIDGASVEIGPTYRRRASDPPEDGADGVAYLFDSKGDRLASYRFVSAAVTPEQVADALGLSFAKPEERQQIEQYLRQMAA